MKSLKHLLQESEGEEAAEARVALAQDMGRGNLASRQSRVRLQEIGPRMELQVVKVGTALVLGLYSVPVKLQDHTFVWQMFCRRKTGTVC